MFLTRQQIVNNVYRHIANQNAAAFNHEKQEFFYKLKTSSRTLNCALGCLLDKNTDTTNFNGIPVRALSYQKKTPAILELEDALNKARINTAPTEISFLSELQSCHNDAANDQSSFTESFMPRLKEVCRRFNLVYPGK